jgi:lipid II:glycine glycyltransferase (peptidoglycan interpeptide bridge formation enzyme)
MKIDRLTPAELPLDVSALLQSSSLLGSIRFLQLWETVGGKVVVWVMHDSGRPVAMLSGVEFRNRPFTRFQAASDGLYLRLVRADQTKTMLDSQETLLASIADHGYARVYLTDYFRELGEMVRMNVSMQTTHLIELTHGWEPPDATLRSEIRKAEREGVSIREFDASRDMDGFLALMKSTDARHGRSPKYPDQFFAQLANLAQTDKRIRWYYLAHEGQPAVSQIYLIEGETALNWQIYFDKQFSSLKPNQSMTFHAAQELMKQGVRYLNMGATPPEAEGVRIYKEKWGGRSVAYPCFEMRSWLGRIL